MSTKSALFALGILAALSCQVSLPSPAMLDQVKSTDAGDEAVSLITQYIQIDTTNPPGNEKLGADFLAAVLKKGGLEPLVYETGPNRAGVYCRLKGNGSKRAVILLNHIDVVPARAEDWRVPPFSGAIQDGEIWGRGALDMKSMGIAELMAILSLKRSGKSLDRDLIFLATPDEEVGGKEGAQWFVKNHPELFKDAEFLINEGASIDTGPADKALYWGVNIAEKSLLWLKLTARGEAGHASMPMPDSAPNRLVRALNKIVNAPPSLAVSPAVSQYFTAIAGRYGEPQADIYRKIDKISQSPDNLNELFKDRLKAAMVRNTISLTVLKSGYKTNVIPAEAEAELDCRLLPELKPEPFIAELKKIIADPAVEISILDWESAGASPYNTEAFEAIKAVAREEDPSLPVVPVVVPWFTDSHWFRDLGIVAYGFMPFKIDAEHMAGMHGKNERIGVNNLKYGVRTLDLVLQRLCLHHS